MGPHLHFATTLYVRTNNAHIANENDPMSWINAVIPASTFPLESY